MASKDDWVKVRTGLVNDNRVLQVMLHYSTLEHPLSALPESLLRVTIVGALSITWGTIRHQGVPLPGGDCLLEGGNNKMVDYISGVSGFGEAMEKVGWVHYSEEGAVFPEFFSDFNTIPKKGKLSDAEKQKAYRERQKAKKGAVTKTVTSLGTEKEKEEESKDISLSNDSDCPLVPKVPKEANCPHQEILALYHKKLPACTTMRSWNGTRVQNLRARWKEHPDLEWWDGFFQYISESKFLTGRSAPRGDAPPFVAGLDWIVKAANFAKINEGNYHRRS